MSTTHQGAKLRALFCFLAVIVGGLLLPSQAVAQSERARGEREGRGENRIEELIERLEIGMSALEELNRHDALEIVQRIANELRQEHARGGHRARQEENDEVRTVRRRLRVMRTAVDAFLEADRHDAADLVERAMHARELSLEGRRDSEANEIRQAAPNRGQLAETLGAAAQLYKKWNKPERAAALAELAETYAKQWRRQQQGAGQNREEERENESGSGQGLDSLATRIEIIRYARAAFAEVGNERNAKALEGAILYGELALEGVTGERLTEAAGAVPSRGNLIEQLNWASRQYREWNRGERAAACRNLAEYYARQLDPASSIEDLNRRIEILGLAHNALREAGHEDWAHTMKRFLQVAELQRDGAEGETIGQALEGLSKGMVIEFLQKASGLYAEWGVEGRAAACNQLAEYYARQVRGEPRESEEKRKSEARNLEDLAQRMDVLRFARAAHAEANHPDARDILERTIHVGELQLTDASPQQIAQASAGLSMEQIVKLTLTAADLYREWGNEDRAAACSSLAEFYIRRTRDQEQEDRK